MRILLAALLGTGALLLGAGTSGATTPHGPAGVVAPHAATAIRASTQTVACSTSDCSAYEAGIDRFFSDVAADSGRTTNVYAVDTQYYDTVGGGTHNIAYQSSFGGSYVDSTAYPANECPRSSGICLTDGQVRTEIQNDIAANNWPTGTGSLFFVFLPTGIAECYGSACSGSSFCAYHDDFAGTGGANIVYAVEPDNESLNGCSTSQSPNGDVAPDATINTVSHEMDEAITDPLPSVDAGWWSNPAEDEIGDLCAWTFGTALGTVNGFGTAYNQVIDGHDYYLQQEYSNSAGGCVQHPGGPVTAPGFGDGSGPLVYQGGPVMRTNTVYAIYWVSTSFDGGGGGGGTPVPSNTAAPVVSGVAAVGRTLTTTAGTWDGSPTSYAYQWQQCSTTGTSCSNIPGATGTSYQLQAADAGHEIRSEVAALNAGGSSSFQPSVASELVLPAPSNAVAPVLSGVAAVGKTLSTTSGAWNTPATYTYDWLRCAGTSCASIPGAHDSTYTVVAADRGDTLEAVISATNAAATTTALSNASAAVIGLPATARLPHISGKTKVGKKLTVDTGAWSDAPTTFHYQWLRCSAKGKSCKPIAGATVSSRKLTKKDAKHRLRVQVTAVNAAGSTSTETAATRTVTATKRR